MARSSPIFVPIVGEDRLSKKLASVQAKVSRFAASVSKVGKSLTSHVTLPLGIAGVASVKLAKDFNESMANVATLIPGQKKRIMDLHDSVLALSVKMGQSTEDLSEGLYQTISAFGDKVEGDTDVTMRNMEIIAKAGVAGRATTVESLKLLSTVTKGYGDTSEEAMQKAADLAMVTVKLGETSYPALAASMSNVIPIAESLGETQEGVFSVFATFTGGALGTARKVATRMVATYNSFLKPSKEMTKGMKSLGFESSVAAVEQLGLRKAIMATEVAAAKKSDRAKALKELGFSSFKAAKGSLGAAVAIEKLSEKLEANKLTMGKFFISTEAMGLVLASLGGQAEAYGVKTKQLVEETKNLGQASAAAYKAQTEGINKFGKDWEQFIAKLQVTGIKLGEKLFPVVEKLLTAIEPLLDKILAADPATLELGLKIAGLAMAIGPLLRVVGGLATGLSGVLGLLAKTRIGVSLLGAGFGGVTRAGAGLGGVTEGLGGVGAGAAGAAGQVSKLGKALGVAGSLAKALGVGLALGEVANQLWFDPQVKRTTAERDKLDTIQQQALETSRHGTREEKIQAFEGLSKAMSEREGAVANVEDVAGIFVSAVSDVESPMERYKAQTKEIVKAQEALLKSIKKEDMIRRVNNQRQPEMPEINSAVGDVPRSQEALVKSLGKDDGIRKSNVRAQAETIETKTTTKEIVEVVFPNAPKGTRVRRSRQGTPALDTGVSMAGAV